LGKDRDRDDPDPIAETRYELRSEESQKGAVLQQSPIGNWWLGVLGPVEDLQAWLLRVLDVAPP